MLIDSDSNNLSLIDVVEEFGVSPEATLPVSIPPLVLVTLWTRSGDDVPCRGHFRVRTLNPAGEESVIIPHADIDLTEFRRLRYRTAIVNFTVTQLGRHVFEVDLTDDGAGGESRSIATVPLDITTGQGPRAR